MSYLPDEPLLERLSLVGWRSHFWGEMPALGGIQGIILGGKSGKGRFYPPEEWIAEIEGEADRLGIPVFEKQNLRKVWGYPPRRELPNG